MRAVILFALLGALVTPARAERVEIGGFVGYNAPYDQADASDDIMGGARLRVPLGRWLKLEPAVTWFDMDREPYRARNVIQEVDRWHMIAGSVNLTLGRNFGEPGYSPYVTGGVGYYFLRKEEAPDQERLGFNLGVGLMVLMRPDLSVDVSGRAERIELESGAARGMLNLRVGVHYHLGQR